MSEQFSEKPNLLPFQQLQQQLSNYIRDPENRAYQPEGGLEIEQRRLDIYAELFFNNLYGLFSQVFPVCKAIIGENRWQQICREFLVKHNAQTPLFHELAGEFLDFLDNEFSPQPTDPEFLLELAHYEWIELVLSVSEEEDFIARQIPWQQIDLAAKFELSPLALPLAYQWPVHQLAADYQPEEPEQATTLLVYRQCAQMDAGQPISNIQKDGIEFIELTPLLYQWLVALNDYQSAELALEAISQDLELNQQALQEFAKQTLQQLMAKGIVRQV